MSFWLTEQNNILTHTHTYKFSLIMHKKWTWLKGAVSIFIILSFIYQILNMYTWIVKKVLFLTFSQWLTLSNAAEKSNWTSLPPMLLTKATFRWWDSVSTASHVPRPLRYENWERRSSYYSIKNTQLPFSKSLTEGE